MTMTTCMHSVLKVLDKTKTDKATARQAVLDRLGITADEAALLLG